MQFSRLRSRLRFGIALALLVGALVATGCDTVGTNGDVSGQLTVKLTDAPGDILEANVTITRVAVVPTDDSASGDANDGGIEVLSEDPLTVDLVQLQEGVTETLGQVEIPEGSYSQIRLVTARSATVYYEDAAGTKQKAQVRLPSAGETGVKINFEEFTIDESGDEIEVTLDFDVEESFVTAGQTGTYVFKPVVQARSVVVNGQTGGSGSS